MSALWWEKQDFKRPYEGIYIGNITEILPYNRLYGTLTPTQLQKLLRDAKRLHWEVLDLHRCGLEALPPELGDLPDLKCLDLGNSIWIEDNFQKEKQNTFSVLPDSLVYLSNLKMLYLDDTPLYRKLPPEMACPKRSEQKIRHDGSKCGILRL